MPKPKRKTKTQIESPRNQAEILFPLLQGTAAALLVATVLFSGESLVRYGNGHLLTTLWFLLAAACAGWNFWNKKSLGHGNLAVTLFFLCVAISAGVHLLPGQGCVRYGLNASFLWLGLAAAFYVFRTVINGSGAQKMSLAILVSLAFAEAMLGVYQYGIEKPQIVRQYESDVEGNLAILGIVPGSPEQMLIENRIYNTEPTGTYPLTNTLAGVLAPPLVLLVGLMLFKRQSRLLTISGGSLALLIGFCLLLTQSRTGYIAVLCGMVLLLGKLAQGRFQTLFSRRTFGIALIVAVACGGLISVAIFIGGLNFNVLAGAKKSLGYRLEYWESTTKMIQDSPWFGCGPGNYQHVYTQFKLPDASEEIADPHNFVMEIASNFGIPALLCFLVFLVALFRKKSCENQTEQIVTNNTPLVVGAFLGFGVVFLCSQISEIPLDWKIAALLAASFAIAIPWVRRLPARDGAGSTGFLVKVTLVVLLVNLLAAGGIAYPNVAVTFWLLAAMLLAGKMPAVPDAGKMPAVPGKDRRPMIHGGLSVAFLLLGLFCYNFSFLPGLQSSVEMNGARLDPHFESRMKRFQKAVLADPFSVEARLALTQGRFTRYVATGSEQALQDAIKEQEVLLRLAPFSAAIRRALGETMLDAYDRRGNRMVLTLAVERLEEAVRFYPNHAKNRAPLTVAYWKADEKDKAVAEAKIAIAFDDSMPHLDQKLSGSLREEIEKLLGIR